MKFSIITPTLNSSKYVEECLRSVHQEQGEVEVEQIVVDGGSSDGTLKIVEDFAKKTGSDISVVHDEGSTIPEAENAGLEKVTGDVWAVMNADDMYRPNVFPELASHFLRLPGVEALYGNLERVDSEGRHVWTYYPPKVSLEYYVRKGFNVGVTHPATLLRRSVIEKVGLFNTAYRYASDYEYLARVLGLCKVERVPVTVARYRVHPSSSSVKSSTRAMQESESLVIAKSLASRFGIAPGSTRVADARALMLQVRRGNLAYLLRRSARRMGGSS